ncbi:hypothetical protein FDB88_01085 [Clostridium sporogenes]|uniref:hypothetical protein n=1 Tax=Clostridium sporogenes TaxID=1509 RepID=UPI0013D794AB|nr:hypothetical protein [Clostridium sporogenes]MDU1422306.1 hypothetical protein [Clostridium botulinum]NFM15860.1 hypothetical protein [Clostridium sporogenes]
MNKKFQFIMLLISALGFLTLSLSHIFRYSLTDFTLGFCEGLSLVCIITWGIFMCYCFIKKKNPYKLS